MSSCIGVAHQALAIVCVEVRLLRIVASFVANTLARLGIKFETSGTRHIAIKLLTKARFWVEEAILSAANRLRYAQTLAAVFIEVLVVCALNVARLSRLKPLLAFTRITVQIRSVGTIPFAHGFAFTSLQIEPLSFFAEESTLIHVPLTFTGLSVEFVAIFTLFDHAESLAFAGFLDQALVAQTLPIARAFALTRLFVKGVPLRTLKHAIRCAFAISKIE